MLVRDLFEASSQTSKSWWNRTQGFLHLNNGETHIQAIAKNPTVFGVDPTSLTATQDDDEWYALLNVVLKNGWVRIASNGQDVQVWRDVRLARAAVAALIEVGTTPQKLFLDVQTDAHNYKSYHLDGDQVAEFADTGRLPRHSL